MEKAYSLPHVERIIESRETVELEECLYKLEGKFEVLDNGGNACVYTTSYPAFKKVCFKKAFEKPQIKYNDIHTECEYQQKAKVKGVRTPSTLISYINEDGEEYLVMEKIEGCTVRDAIENPNLLPPSFDYWTFCRDLENQIALLHKPAGLSSQGIYHRDLHDRNVMINNEGLAVIIDFGTSTEATGGEFTYDEGVSLYNENTKRYDFVDSYFKNDDMMVNNIKSSLKFLMK